jgi:hypothetical protein
MGNSENLQEVRAWTPEEVRVFNEEYQKVQDDLWRVKTSQQISAMTMSKYSQWRKAGGQYFSVFHKEEPVVRIPQTRISRVYGTETLKESTVFREISSYELYRNRYIAEGWLEDLYRMVEYVTESE